MALLYPQKTGIFKTLLRGIRLRCPRCGQGQLFRKFYHLIPKCDHCDLIFVRDPTDILAFMYLSAALITGFFILGILFIIPTNQLWGRILLTVLALLVMLGSLPFRKGLAIAIDFLTDRSINS